VLACYRPLAIGRYLNKGIELNYLWTFYKVAGTDHDFIQLVLQVWKWNIAVWKTCIYLLLQISWSTVVMNATVKGYNDSHCVLRRIRKCVGMFQTAFSTISRSSCGRRHRYPHLRRFFFVVLRSSSNQFRDNNNYITVTSFRILSDSLVTSHPAIRRSTLWDIDSIVIQPINKQTPWLLVHKRTITTERPPLGGEVSANLCGYRMSHGQRNRFTTAVNLGFLDRSSYFSIQVAPQLSSRGWVDPVPDPLLLRKSGSPGNRIRDLWISIQELWPLDHRGGRYNP
jgi:hypothetical protein